MMTSEAFIPYFLGSEIFCGLETSHVDGRSGEGSQDKLLGSFYKFPGVLCSGE